MKEIIATGETVELAKQKACQALGLETCEDCFEILEMPTKKTFGLFGGSEAKIRVTLRETPLDIATDFLTKIAAEMGAKKWVVQSKVTEGNAVITMQCENESMLIGPQGETLEALQYLVGLVANKHQEPYCRITLDVANYRAKREKALVELGEKTAEKACKLNKNYALEPMNPYERSIVHHAVEKISGAKSWSEGEDAMRHVVIGKA